MSKPDPAELDDFEGDLPPDELESPSAPEEEYPLWNRRSSKIAIVNGVVNRNHVLVAQNSPCVDCAARGKVDRTHQFHLKCSKVDGVWFGPDATHLQDLIASGVISRTKEAKDRAKRQQVVDLQRGVEGSNGPCPNTRCNEVLSADQARCPQCGTANGLPELHALTLKQMQHLWRLELPIGGSTEEILAKVQARELGELREAATSAATAKATGAAVIEALLRAGVIPSPVGRPPEEDKP